MNNLARVAVLALGAFAAKKYMNTRAVRGTVVTDTTSATADPTATAGGELLDASGAPIDTTSAQARARAQMRSMAQDPRVSWLADPELRQRNLQRLKEIWAQRHSL